MSKYLVENWLKRLVNSRVPEPRLSIRYILEDVLSMNLANMDIPKGIDSLIINAEQIKDIEKLIFRREHHEPIQYILGKWPFRNLDLQMKPPVFIPRPETQELVDIVKSLINKDTRKNAIEIGVGSGAISLSLLQETNLNIFAIDKSKEAIDLTLENLNFNKLDKTNFKIFQIDLATCCSCSGNRNTNMINEILNEKFDILVSNPPYIPYGKVLSLEPQILWYESIDALNGGFDGLDVIKSILDLVKYIMNDEGLIVLEVDETHPEMFGDLLKSNPQWQLKLINIHKDCFDRPRFVILQCGL